MNTIRMHIEDMLVGAFEGGSNYWYWINDWEHIKKATPAMKGEPFVMRVMQALDMGLTLDIYDAEDETEKLGTLSWDSCVKALDLMKENHEVHYLNLIAEEGDAETADVFLQLAVLGELTFG